MGELLDGNPSIQVFEKRISNEHNFLVPQDSLASDLVMEVCLILLKIARKDPTSAEPIT